MPVVTCPGCGRAIDLPAHELSLSSITCAGCETPFRPAMAEVLPPSRRHVQRGTLVVCGILVGALVFFGVLLTFVLHRNSAAQDRASNQGGAEGGRGKGRPADEGDGTKGAAHDDKELIRRYIARNAPDSSRVRILGWGPSLTRKEVEAWNREAGTDLGLDGYLRQLRVRYQAPEWELKPTDQLFGERIVPSRDYRANPLPGSGLAPSHEYRPSERLKEHDEFYEVTGTLVRRAGAVEGGDRWKEQLRRDLSRAHPALNP